jgi:hypothetical protein
MPEMRFRQPNIARLAQATAADALRVRALNPCSRHILGCEVSGLLPVSRGPDSFAMDLRPHGELVRRTFGPGARLADRAGATGRGMQTHPYHGIPRDIKSWGSLHPKD